MYTLLIVGGTKPWQPRGPMSALDALKKWQDEELLGSLVTCRDEDGRAVSKAQLREVVRSSNRPAVAPQASPRDSELTLPSGSSQDRIMDGFIIETWQPDASFRWVATRWIGIAVSAKAMIGHLPGTRPSVIDRGPSVLRRAQALGLKYGQVGQLKD